MEVRDNIAIHPHLVMASTSVRGDLREKLSHNSAPVPKNTHKKKTVQQLPTYANLAFSNLAPAAVTVWSMHPSNVAFRGLLCRGLQMRGGQCVAYVNMDVLYMC